MYVIYYMIHTKWLLASRRVQCGKSLHFTDDSKISAASAVGLGDSEI